jgi:hypothetical protein
MYISLIESRAKGFRRWSETHQPHSNDDADGVARADALAIAAMRIRGDDGTSGAACAMARARVGNTF